MACLIASGWPSFFNSINSHFAVKEDLLPCFKYTNYKFHTAFHVFQIIVYMFSWEFMSQLGYCDANLAKIAEKQEI